MVLTSTHLNIARINRIVTGAWVDFGEPAMDCSGNGPYIVGEASIDHLGYIVDLIGSTPRIEYIPGKLLQLPY